MIQAIKAIDMHTHINHGVVGDSDSTPYEVYRADVDFLKKMNEAAGIEKMFVSSFSSVLSTERIAEENLYMRELSLREPSLYMWVVIDPRFPETIRQADEMLGRGKCVGIKMHPAYHQYSLADYYGEITEIANKHRTRLLIHHEKGGLQTMVRIAKEFPNIQVINPHLGSIEDVDALVESGVHGNMWVDTSGIASSRNAIIEYAFERAGADRIMFGTDTYAAGFQRGRIEYAMIPESAKEKILRYNAEGLFSDALNR